MAFPVPLIILIVTITIIILVTGTICLLCCQHSRRKTRMAKRSSMREGGGVNDVDASRVTIEAGGGTGEVVVVGGGGGGGGGGVKNSSFVGEGKQQGDATEQSLNNPAHKTWSRGISGLGDPEWKKHATQQTTVSRLQRPQSCDLNGPPDLTDLSMPAGMGEGWEKHYNEEAGCEFLFHEASGESKWLDEVRRRGKSEATKVWRTRRTCVCDGV